MVATSLQQLGVAFLASVAAAAVRSLALASVAGALLVLFRLKNVSLRLAIWKVVLWSALAMPLLAWLAPPMPFALPRAVISQLARFIPAGETFAQAASPYGSSDAAATRVRTTQWPTHSESADAQATRGGVASPSETRTALSIAASPRITPAANPASGGAVKHWNISGTPIAIAIYLAMAILLLSRLFVGWMLGRRLIRTSQPIRDPRASLSLSLRAFPGHLYEAPLLAESEAVTVPVTLGVLRPVILLPADWREWESDKLNAVLAHELSHIGRNDALTQRLSKLHRAIYWFSPLAWWLDRELARLAEEASDEAALASGADRERYAEMLLRFFEAIRAASGRVWWQGVSMAAGGDAAKRVDRILTWKGAVTMRLRKTFVAALAAIALPLLLAAASIQFTVHAQQTAPPPRVAPVVAVPPQAPTLAPSAPPAPRLQPVPYAMPDARDIPPPAPAAPDLAPPSPRYVTAVPPAPATPGVAPPAQLAPLAPMAPQSVQVQSGDSNVWVMDDEHVREPFVIAVGGSYIGVFNHSVTISDSGESEELAHAKALHTKIGGDFIWFEHEGKGYVIRDRATLDRAMELYKPIQELGAEQDELGKKQDELGKQQDELGDQMDDVKVKIPDMTEDIEHIKERVRELNAKGGTQSEIGELQSELGELQSRIGEIQSQAGREQSKIGRQQGELGRKQGELGRQQGAIGRKQGELSKKAVQQMESILDEARAKGLTQPE
jgi:beta-lactamase regulating signal transducer with metallopeptidase domain